MGAVEDGIRGDDYGWSTAAPAHSGGYLIPAVMSELAKHREVDRVLDIGAGNGALCARLLDDGYRSVGIDADERGTRIAADAHPGGRFYTLAVEDPPQTLLEVEEPFDAVVSTEVVEHLYTPRLLLAFAHSALKPDGLLLLTTPYHGYLKNVAIAATGQWDRHHTAHWDGGHIKFWSRRTLTTLVEGNGFAVTGFRGIGRAPLLWRSMMLVARRTDEQAEPAAGHETDRGLST